MQNSLFLVCDDPKRAAAFQAAAESDGLVVTLGPSDGRDVGALAEADIIAADCTVPSADLHKNRHRHAPLLLVIDDTDAAALGVAASLGAASVLRRNAPRIETAARLRAVSRLRMLRDEVEARGGAPFRTPRKRRVAAIGVEGSERLADANAAIVAFERGPGAFIASASGRCDAVVLSAAMGIQECRLFITQMRAVASMRNVAALICDIPVSDGQNAAWLDIGANDLFLADATPALLRFQLLAACERRDLTEALKRLARDAAKKISEAGPTVDPATGLSGEAAFKKALETSAKRMFAQGKAISVLVIRPDMAAPDSDLPESMAVAVADVLRRSLRGFDLASRISPSVFAILMPGVAGDAALAAANRICAAIAAEKIRVGDQRQAGLTCSIGVATATHAAESQGLAEKAHGALHKVQAEGQGKAVVARAA